MSAFSCSRCSKAFTSQGSLARHEQNHADSAKHVCHVCGVIFRRRDLLTRHMKLHGPSNASPATSVSSIELQMATETDQVDAQQADNCDRNAGDAIAGADANGASPPPVSPGIQGPTRESSQRRVFAGRKRCHTACNRCRDLKIKCDGHHPCAKCRRSRKPCEFQHSAGRRSQMPTLRDALEDNGGLSSTARGQADVSTSARLSATAAFPTLSSLSPDRSGSSNGMHDVAHSAAGSNNSEDPGPTHDTHASHWARNDDANAPAPPDVLPWDAPGASGTDNMTFWPWLHEGLLLSDDSLGLFSALDCAQQSYVGDPFSLPELSIPTGVAAPAGHFSPTHHQTPALQPDIGLSAPAPAPAFSATAATPPSSRPFAQPSTLARSSFGPWMDGSATLQPPNLSGRSISGQLDGLEKAALKRRAVDDLVSLASQHTCGSAGQTSAGAGLTSQWPQGNTSDLVEAFDFASDPAPKQAVFKTTADVLHHFLQLYKDHFHPLWPMLPRRHLTRGEIHPLLLMVLASIGAMYMGRLGSECGAIMHNALRRHLVMPVELDITEDSLIWLAQARCLTQVAALYFGQSRAFSYAQHLGTLLTTQARRMCLFSAAVHRQRVSQFARAKGIATDAERLDLWIDIEVRRRLAFGIFRSDTFTSVLLNTKPIVTLDEIDIEFPCCDAVWNGEHMEPRVALEMIEHDCTPSRDLRASDLYYILLETDEILPPLEPVAHELLLFGLQPLVWRFSFDRPLADKIPASQEGGFDEECASSHKVEHSGTRLVATPPITKRKRRDTFASEAESLDTRSYEMCDLRMERQRLNAALSKWERALPLAKSFARTEQDRSHVLSSLILYHMSFLRLNAPVDDIHQIHYRVVDKRPIATNLLDGVKDWSRSPKARLAIERVRSMWSLIKQQIQLGQGRSRFNFNAFIGLHHGAAILWAYNGAQNQDPSQDFDVRPQGGSDLSPSTPFQADRSETIEIFKTFLELFHKVSPAQWSCFADVTVSTAQFPVDESQTQEQ